MLDTDQTIKLHKNSDNKAVAITSSNLAKKSTRKTRMFVMPYNQTSNEISSEDWQDIIQQVIVAFKNSNRVQGSLLNFASKLVKEPIGFNAICVELLNDKNRPLQAKIAILFVIANLIETNPGKKQLMGILKEKVNSPVDALILALVKKGQTEKQTDWDSLNDLVDKINRSVVTKKSDFKPIDEQFPLEVSEPVFKCQSPQPS